MRDIGWDAIGEALADSDILLENTIGGDCEAVSRALDAIHESNTEEAWK